jgi:hypothetical protein
VVFLAIACTSKNSRKRKRYHSTATRVQAQALGQLAEGRQVPDRRFFANRQTGPIEIMQHEDLQRHRIDELELGLDRLSRTS